MVREFARELYADLPTGKSVVLSEDLIQLLLLRAALAAGHHDKDVVPLETLSLASARYQRLMAKQFASRWPVAPPTNGVAAMGPFEQQDLISAFAAREQVVYLHPSSGLFLSVLTRTADGATRKRRASSRSWRSESYRL